MDLARIIAVEDSAAGVMDDCVRVFTAFHEFDGNVPTTNFFTRSSGSLSCSPDSPRKSILYLTLSWTSDWWFTI